jgi:hypothetical protein
MRALLMRAAIVTLILAVLSACAPGIGGSPGLLHVYATSAASPWLRTAYDCTPADAAIVLGGADEADVILRLAEPRELAAPAFQIGIDDLLVVTHPQVAVGALSEQQVEAIFSGQISRWNEIGGADQAVQVWVYASAVDIQAFFNRTVLDDRPVSSVARLAVSAQDMSDSVGSTPGSLGLLPRRWKAGNTREALVVASVPVLAVTAAPPQGALAELIACMQSQP